MKTIIVAAVIAASLAASAALVSASGICFYTGEDTTQTKRLCHYLCPTAGNITTPIPIAYVCPRSVDRDN
jgi:hypothetical protein